MKQLLIGRAPDNDIVISDKFVSRHHCTLNIYDDGRASIMDLGSKTGTFVNGRRINGETLLNRGDRVRIGSGELPWENYIQVAQSANSFSTPNRDFSSHSGRRATAQETPPQTPPVTETGDTVSQPSRSGGELLIPRSIYHTLPSMVQSQLVNLPADMQMQFLEEYKRRRKSIFLAYVLWFIFGLHYGYLHKWGVQIIYWLTGGGFLIWAFIDLFRIPGLLRNYNRMIAIETLKDIKLIHA